MRDKMSSKSRKLVTVDYQRIVASYLLDHSIAEMCEHFGVTRQTVYRWQTGHTPRPEQRDALVAWALAVLDV